MSGLAGVVRWDGDPRAAAADLASMLGALAHRGPDGVSVHEHAGCAFGHARLCLRVCEHGWSQPVVGRESGCVLVADARLYGRDELARLLGRDRPYEAISDAALLLAGWERWGEDLLGHLDGDYAFAVFDPRARRVFAARDPFGAKPFFFHHGPDEFAFASETRALRTLPVVSDGIDDLIVGEFLFRRFEDLRHTFHADVRRLRPAHLLVATACGVEERRWWRPDPARVLDATDHDDIVAAVRTALDAAVAKRLDVDGPVVAQLSGGMDSSSLVAVAGALYRQGRTTPVLETVSEVFPGLDCDESPYIDAVCERVPFENHRVRPLDRDPLDGLEAEIAALDHPWVDLQRGGTLAQTDLLGARGAHVLLTGLGGDELFHAEYYLRDLARRGRMAALLAETWRGSRRSWNGFGRLLLDALHAAAPQPVRDAWRRCRPDRWQPPIWAAPDFVRGFLAQPVAPPPCDGGFPSLTREWAFRWVTYPGITWAIEALELKAAHAGLEVRHPLLDRSLVETVLAVPFAHRRLSGHWKRLLEEAVRDVLPPVVADRRRKTHFANFAAVALAQASNGLRQRLGAPESWASGAWVQPERAWRLLEAPRSDGHATGAAWRVACLELWLRSRVADRPRG